MKYEIVIVLCPEKTDKDGRFPEFKDGKYLGGQTRMNATCEIFKKNKKAEFIIVGGYDPNDNDRSQKMIDMENFLEEQCKKIKVVKCPSLPCTRHNLIAIFNTWKKKSKDIKGKRIGLLTNFYHLPRTLRFWGELVNKEEFKKIPDPIPTPIPIAAESVSQISGEIYIRFTEYILRIDKERDGLRDIENGIYIDSCLLEENFNQFKRVLKNKQDILLTNEERKKFKEKLK
jgi:hypothetical protein